MRKNDVGFEQFDIASSTGQRFFYLIIPINWKYSERLADNNEIMTESDKIVAPGESFYKFVFTLPNADSLRQFDFRHTYTCD